MRPENVAWEKELKRGWGAHVTRMLWAQKTITASVGSDGLKKRVDCDCLYKDTSDCVDVCMQPDNLFVTVDVLA